MMREKIDTAYETPLQRSRNARNTEGQQRSDTMFVRKSTLDSAISIYEQRLDVMVEENQALRSDLAHCWVRNERGHFQRHPLNTGGAK